MEPDGAGAGVYELRAAAPQLKAKEPGTCQLLPACKHSVSQGLRGVD